MRLRRPFLDPDGAVVVITGASSGIGRLTARRLARRGARVVLAARDVPALEETARACRGDGGDALVVATDVSDPDAVTALARRAEKRRDDHALRVLLRHQQVRAARLLPRAPPRLPHRTGHRRQLRAAVLDGHTDLPGGGQLFRAPDDGHPPVADPDRVARVIERCFHRPRNEVRVGYSGRFFALGEQLAAPLYDRVINRAFRLLGFTGEEVPASEGNLYEPIGAPVSGSAAPSPRRRPGPVPEARTGR